MNLPRLFCVVLAGAAVLTTACGSDVPNGPTTPATAPLDVAALLAEIGRATPIGVRGEMGVSGANAMSAIAPTTCTYVAASQSFTCPTQGPATTFSYMLLDAAGRPQSAPNVATTAAIRTISTFHGPLGFPVPVDIAFDFDRTDEMTLSGLLTGVHSLNGTAKGTSEYKTTSAKPTIIWATADKSTITNVVLPRSGSPSPWPVSGTITTDQNISLSDGISSENQRTLHTVMTFNGSSDIVVTVTFNGVTTTCTIGLEAPPDRAGESACLTRA